METNNKFLYGVYAQGNAVRLYLSGRKEIDSAKKISNEVGYASKYHRRDIFRYSELDNIDLFPEYGQIFDDDKNIKELFDLHIDVSHMVQLPVKNNMYIIKQIIDGYMPMICIANPDNFKQYYIETIAETTTRKQRYKALSALTGTSKLYFGMHVNSIVENFKKNNIDYIGVPIS